MIFYLYAHYHQLQCNYKSPSTALHYITDMATSDSELHFNNHSDRRHYIATPLRTDYTTKTGI